jgi:hypothetical protein
MRCAGSDTNPTPTIDMAELERVPGSDLRMLKTIAGALGLALILILLPATLAGADFRGTDMWGNLAPSSSRAGERKYPISYYQLDYYVDGPSVGFSGDLGGRHTVDKLVQVSSRRSSS